MQLLELPHAVAPRDMADFVCQDTGQFTHGPSALDEPAIDVDPPTRQRKGVDLLGIHHGEGPGETTGIRGRRELAPEYRDVLRDQGIMDERQFPAHLSGARGSEGDLLLLGDGTRPHAERCQQHGGERLSETCTMVASHILS